MRHFFVALLNQVNRVSSGQIEPVWLPHWELFEYGNSEADESLPRC